MRAPTFAALWNDLDPPRHLRGGLLSLALCLLPLLSVAQDANPYPAASHVPSSQPGWEGPDPDAPLDEAQGGMTALGTPIAKRNEHCFPAETRNLFSEVDMVASGPNGELQPFDYTDGKFVTEAGRHAIQGQNTWLLWGEGNEAFWGWLTERGYGLVDFLILVDSRDRGSRFKKGGMINQPGMKSTTTKNLLGLYLDVADGAAIKLRQPPGDIDAATGKLAERPVPPANHPKALFEAGDQKFYDDVVASLPDDGLDPAIYGYASGVVGLRLMPNPDFFGKTKDAERARQYWKERVNNGTDAYYTDTRISADPKLVRPFRMSMACAYCHVSMHPLNPPANPEEPAWANISGVIGSQYWRPEHNFANLSKPDNFLHHYLASQQPGTIDTSLVSTDHINNANTMNAVFDVPGRLARALQNPTEKQSAANMLLPGVEDNNKSDTMRHVPRVLVDGSDSIGVFGALARVYLNIGTFPEEWSRCDNPIIGFKPQKPFALATVQKNSVYWRAGVRYRVPYLAAYFTHADFKSGQSISQPMKLAHAPGGAGILAAEQEAAGKGREVFLDHCAICHSSKQPAGFGLEFSADWARHGAPAAGQPAAYTAPQGFEDWEAFKASAAYADYKTRLRTEVADKDPAAFLKDNFLSSEIRIPVTLVGTNSGRAVATNAMRGQVWDNFSSDTYKQLPAVGQVHFYNPWSDKPVDGWGNNDTYTPPGGGPGYYRPASLISVWATSPYLHNNTLGLYNADPSVPGRLKGFEDGIDKLLWNGKRASATGPHMGDLRASHKDLAGADPGFIYRTTEASAIAFAPGFTRPLLASLIGDFWVSFLASYVWIGLVLLLLLLAFIGRPRHVAFLALLAAIAVAAVAILLRLDKVYWWIWLIPPVLVLFAAWLWLGRERRGLARGLFAVLALAALGTGVLAHRFIEGKSVGLAVGPIPQGTPVNLLMNMNPEAVLTDQIQAVGGLVRAMLLVRRDGLEGRAAQKVFDDEAASALLRVSKCPDFVLDRGHWFGESLTDAQKQELKAYLKTL
jgi:hypothetical protein